MIEDKTLTLLFALNGFLLGWAWSRLISEWQDWKRQDRKLKAEAQQQAEADQAQQDWTVN